MLALVANGINSSRQMDLKTVVSLLTAVVIFKKSFSKFIIIVCIVFSTDMLRLDCGCAKQIPECTSCHCIL
jgi:hypothetical protein